MTALALGRVDNCPIPNPHAAGSVHVWVLNDYGCPTKMGYLEPLFASAPYRNTKAPAVIRHRFRIWRLFLAARRKNLDIWNCYLGQLPRELLLTVYERIHWKETMPSRYIWVKQTIWLLGPLTRVRLWLANEKIQRYDEPQLKTSRNKYDGKVLITIEVPVPGYYALQVDVRGSFKVDSLTE